MASLKVPQFSFAKHKAMAKSNYFSSKSIFGQLISLIDDKKKKEAVKNTILSYMLNVLRVKIT
jgi:hypothetical protein